MIDKNESEQSRTSILLLFYDSLLQMKQNIVVLNVIDN